MKERTIFDPGQPVAIRAYPAEAFASLDQARLEAADIPSFVRQNNYAEADAGRVVLIVRREHAAAALALLNDDSSPDDSVSDATPDDES